MNVTEGALVGPSIEERTRRQEALLATIDDKTPLERLFDFITASRLQHYRPDLPADLRRDLPCFCCGYPYRPDNPMDAINLYLCGTCIYERLQEEI